MVSRLKELGSVALQQMISYFHQIRQFILRYIPKRPKRAGRFLLRLAIIGLGVVILSAMALFAWYYKDLPKPGELRARSASESTILYDRTGKQIYDISGDERRILITSKDIPNVMKEATVSIEDHNFYHHHGVDFRGLIRGVILRPITGHSIEGGSTITQQYIKNAVLSPKRSLSRKFKEIILSLEIEAVYSKDDILTLYLNEIPYGANIYGVEAASQAYFGHSAKDGLTLSEAATLASIPQLPSYYSPYGSHVDDLMLRKNLVLNDMAKYGYITTEQATTAKTQAPLVSKDFAQPRANFPAPHFVMYVREQLEKKYGEELVQRGGLRVTTTLDLDTQKIADDVIKDKGAKLLPKVKASNASLVAMDPKTGQILAMVGSLDYFDREHEGNFNVATSPSRQPGSAIKPIVYSTLFKDKYAPGSLLWDVPTNFNGYKPNNFDSKFHGPLSIRQALGNSFNVPAVKALQLEGVNNFLKTAGDVGITTLTDKASAGLSLALGGGEVKLVDLTAAYSVLANHGERHPMTSMLKITDSHGKVLDEWKDDSKQVLAPEITYEISSIMSDSEAKKPTFGQLLGVLTVPGKTVAVKTGTTENYKDAWTLGFTPSLVAGVWAGNNDGSEMDHGGGSTAAAPIWQAFMAKALANKPNEAFFKPDDVDFYTVDFLSGKKLTNASGQQMRDLYAPWQLPNQNDDVHTSVKVCKSDGKLAPNNAPADLVDTKIFTHVYSEHPDNPDWENPVQAWARDHNLSSNPPTETCDLSAIDPLIKITNPANNDSVTGIFTVTTDVTLPPNNSATVDFSLDGAYVSTANQDPYTARLDTSTMSNGSHTIGATVHSSNGKSTSDSITINTSGPKDTTPPGDVTNVILTPSHASANISWTNPTDSDLADVSFYVSQVSGVKGARNSTVASSPGSVQTTKLSGLVSGVTNYVTIVTTDTANNSSPTTKQYTVVPI